MIFSSIPFLYYFLPVFLIVYFLVPQKCKNLVLLLASLFFYGWGEPKYVFLMLGYIAVSYIAARGIAYFTSKEKQGMARAILAIALFLCFGGLGYFKYADFFIDNFNKLFAMNSPLLQIALPIGISFYIFQLSSYLIDVYREKVAANRNLISLGAYISMFPQLIAGPIVRYTDIEAQLEKKDISAENIAYGIRRFVIGLSKKVLIADSLGLFIDLFRGSDEKTVVFYWLYAIAFTLQIYFDFSGYSDMAIGLGKMLGFHFCENFNYPYLSKSITEFWRRWHISLGSWFRDYVYIPLGGNRVNKARFLFNLFMVWFLTGFWHGADWNFILWGLYFALFLIIEKQFTLKYLERWKIVGHVTTVLLVIFGFVLFNGNGMSGVISDFAALFGVGVAGGVSASCAYYFKSYLFVFIFAIIGACGLPTAIVSKVRAHAIGEKVCNVLEPIVLAVLLLVVTGFLVDGSFAPFLYFRF